MEYRSYTDSASRRQQAGVVCVVPKFMDDSKLFKLPTHSVNATDLHLWKQYRKIRNYGTFKSGTKRVFRCPMFNRCGCKAGVKIFESATLLELYFLGEHNESSHDEDKSKYLKHKQIVAVYDGARVCPQPFCAVIWRLRLRPVPRNSSIRNTFAAFAIVSRLCGSNLLSRN